MQLLFLILLTHFLHLYVGVNKVAQDSNLTRPEFLGYTRCSNLLLNAIAEFRNLFTDNKKNNALQIHATTFCVRDK